MYKMSLGLSAVPNLTAVSDQIITNGFNSKGKLAKRRKQQVQVASSLLEEILKLL
jgi:hypothetical protein